ncbi:uncharacterized protein [Antedon mediterranea]
MECKYFATPNGILRIIEAILLIIGFGLMLDTIVDCVDAANAEACRDEFWAYYVYMAIAITVASLIAVTLIGHLIKPEWINPIIEIGICVVFAILVLIGSDCLAYKIKEIIDLFKPYHVEQKEQIAACVFGFGSVVLLLVECILLGIKALSA